MNKEINEMSGKIFDTFDGNEIDSINLLIDKLAHSSFDYLKLESEGRQIVIAKKGMDIVEVSATKGATPQVESVRSMESTGPFIAAPQGEVVKSMEGAGAEPAIAKISEKEVQEEAGVVIIKSPSHGLYYAQAGPGSPPFVTIGKKVKKGDTVGLLEIMKVYSAITTHVGGEVVKIYVGNEELLEPGQALIAIKVK